jgi:cytidyltransferase-like protein
MKRAMFIGRWQPFHNGHKWLIDQKLSEGVPVLIAVRDIPPDEKNPLTTEETMAILSSAYEGHDAHVIAIPDIESVNYGRGVGYEINEFVPPSNIGYISATEIRKQIRSGDDSWKENVDEKVHALVENYLR